MKIILIAATDQQNGIGKNGTLAWHVPEDMSHFLRTTKGHTVVMGRKTFESLRSPLKNRFNWVLSRTFTGGFEGVRVLNSVEDVLNMAVLMQKIGGFCSVSNLLQAEATKQLFIIGGAEIYKAFEPYANRYIITVISGNYDCDVFFPDFDSSKFNLVDVEVLTVDAKVYYYERK